MIYKFNRGCGWKCSCSEKYHVIIYHQWSSFKNLLQLILNHYSCQTSPHGMISTNLSKMFFSLFFAPIPIKLKNKDMFSKIIITKSEKMQPISFATISNFLSSKEGEKYLIAMQENNSHWSCEKVLKNKPN